MNALLAADAVVELLWTGSVWGEGPVWLPATSALRWSDIPNNRILQFDAASGAVSVYRDGAEYTNGRTLDLRGDVVQCSHGRRAVERDVDGRVETIVGGFALGRFNSPNDVVVARDGAIWFTDPPYGIQENGHEGHPGTQDYDGCWVFRYDPVSRVAEPVITDLVHPNGLAFSPDEGTLYVSDTASSTDDAANAAGAPDQGAAGSVPRSIRCYDTTTLAGRDFAAPTGLADGLRVDTAGNVWTSSHRGVEVFSPAGDQLLYIEVPERVSNLCFGGDDGTDLYITASTSLYRIGTTARDAARRVLQTGP
ncbi:SMP-30/gluconolactonase/LRE family protein [Marisediminicola senii]|uniref:SMP-30/gluconolactonase/LRE family protein n=1 Tax=Marisediminicola senii TaxID=2711233 RepID=UPI0013ECAFA8|nr:SMP-30/gluconolactonase/LRE family protein [Marisediminicola senii]